MATTVLVEKAKEIARRILENHYRQSGEGSFEHAEKVVFLLQDLGVTDENTLAAAYLHHSLEIPHNVDLEKETNSEVFQLIKDYKNLSENHFSNISSSLVNADLLVQTYFNIAKNQKTLLIRLADKTANIRSTHKLPKDLAHKIAERALYVYSPLCKLIGLPKFVNILEDGAFKILNPREYYKIDHYIKINFPRINHELEDAKTFLHDIFEENAISCEIEFRTKSIYSIHKKLTKLIEKGLLSGENRYKKIHDFAGIRILVNTEEDCFKCEDMVRSLWDPIENTRDDYITNPKPNGYKSLQCSYFVSDNFILEVQIRTFVMHEENQFGQASHTLYKIGQALNKNIEDDPNLLKNINYTINREEFDIKPFSKSVYVYTPKGDIKRLPRDSNLLDFAYSIHRDLGSAAIGGEVNGKFKPLEHVLQDGDMVNIKTLGQKKAPSPKFLDLVKTKKAKSEIRKAAAEKDGL